MERQNAKAFIKINDVRYNLSSYEGIRTHEDGMRMRSSHGSTCPYPEAHFTGAYSSPSAPHLTPFITHSYALLVSWPENIVRRA